MRIAPNDAQPACRVARSRSLSCSAAQPSEFRQRQQRQNHWQAGVAGSVQNAEVLLRFLFVGREIVLSAPRKITWAAEDATPLGIFRFPKIVAPAGAFAKPRIKDTASLQRGAKNEVRFVNSLFGIAA